MYFRLGDGVIRFGDAARTQPAVRFECRRRPAAEFHRVAWRGADAAADAAASGRGASPFRGHSPHRWHRATPLVCSAAAAAQEEHAVRPDDQGHQNAPHTTTAAGTADAAEVCFLLPYCGFIYLLWWDFQARASLWQGRQLLPARRGMLHGQGPCGCRQHG